MQLVNSEILEGLTFDDVLLVPARSEVLPRSVDVSTKFTREISLHTPIVSSAMDTVTEADLAIAMARSGGIGVIHKNMTIEQQCEQVRRVKRAENGMIYDPVTIGPEATVGDALALMAKQHIGGIPVVDNAGKLIGIITNRDLRFQDNRKLSISEVMTKENLITAKKGISLEEATCILRSSKVEKLPVVDDDNTLVGLITYKDLMKIKDNPIASKDSKGRLLVAAAVGVKSDTLDRIEMLVSAGADAVVIDTAHGHSVGVLGVIAKACEAFKNRDIQIVAGNVATGEGAKALADELKVVKETIPTSFTSSNITDWATATSNFEVITNKKTTLDNADDTHYPTTKTVKDNLDTKVSGNKITSINNTSSDTEIPTAKAVYELYNSIPKWEVKSVASVDALMGMTGEAGKIYLVANNGSGSNAFDEYFWNDSLEVPAFEKFGSINVDMTDLVTMPQVKNYINSNLSVSLPSTGADAGKLIIELN